MKKCECEDAVHSEPCNKPASIALNTVYGKFMLCKDCFENGHMQSDGKPEVVVYNGITFYKGYR